MPHMTTRQADRAIKSKLPVTIGDIHHIEGMWTGFIVARDRYCFEFREIGREHVALVSRDDYEILPLRFLHQTYRS